MEKQPQSISQIFADVSAAVLPGMPGNETVRMLANNIPAQIRIIKELEGLKQTNFINLAQGDESLIAMSLYAGDGIVTKITRSNYTANTTSLPYVLPAFSRKEIPLGKDHEDGVSIENYPYIDTANITSRDVDNMKASLAECGMAFKTNDDRPANLGRLPDGSLAVLDGDAVIVKPGIDQDALKRYSAAWAERIERNYPDLYKQGFVYTQSPEISFTLKPRATPVEQPPEPPMAKKHWYERVLRNGLGESRMGK